MKQFFARFLGFAAIGLLAVQLSGSDSHAFGRKRKRKTTPTPVQTTTPSEAPGTPKQVANQLSFGPGMFTLNSEEQIEVGNWRLKLQSDGNLVVYEGETPHWSSDTTGHNCQGSSCQAKFQSDGNFVLYDNGAPYWYSNTYNSGAYEFIFATEGAYFYITDSAGQTLWRATDGGVKVQTTPPVVETGPIGPGGFQRGVPDERAFVKWFSDSHPGLLADCTGKPQVTEFMLQLVRELQKRDGRWGYLKKFDGRIPRDILAYAWDTQMEGSQNAFIVDFVYDGCNNLPGEPGYNDSKPNAQIVWSVLNEADGFVGHGVWGANP